MAGELGWLQISQAQIFLPEVLKNIVDEFPSEEDATLITDNFFPMKLEDDDRVIALIRDGISGRTPPAPLVGETPKWRGTGGIYEKAFVGSYAEAVQYQAEELLKVRMPTMPGKLWGLDRIGTDLAGLNVRLDHLIESLSAELLFKKVYTLNEGGIYLTYSSKIPNKFYIDVGASPASGFTAAPWVSGSANNLWTAAATCNPIRDLREAIKWAKRYGLTIEEIWMNGTTAGEMEDSTVYQNMVKGSYTLAEKMLGIQYSIKALTPGLKGAGVRIDDRVWRRETYLTVDSASGSSTFYVDNAIAFSAGDYITLFNSAGDSEQLIVSTTDTTTPGMNQITTTGNSTLAHAAGDRVQKFQLYVPDGYIALKAKFNPNMSVTNWISTPALENATDLSTPKPGKWTASYVERQRRPYWAEVAVGINGGPITWGANTSNWIILKVV